MSGLWLRQLSPIPDRVLTNLHRDFVLLFFYWLLVLRMPTGTSRNHRGFRNNVRLVADLPEWACNLWILFRGETNRPTLVAAAKALKWLLRQVEEKIRQLDGRSELDEHFV